MPPGTILPSCQYDVKRVFVHVCVRYKRTYLSHARRDVIELQTATSEVM
jgi:hypothetical protein